MPVEYRTGDLFAQDDVTTLAHGCNCAGAMGRGIAVEFKRRWFQLYLDYKAACARGDLEPGGVFVWTAKQLTVFNLGTQVHWRSGARMEWVEQALLKMVAEAESRSIARVAMPRIGAGLGGLPWDQVRALIDSVGARTDVMLVVVSMPGADREPRRPS